MFRESFDPTYLSGRAEWLGDKADPKKVADEESLMYYSLLSLEPTDWIGHLHRL